MFYQTNGSLFLAGTVPAWLFAVVLVVAVLAVGIGAFFIGLKVFGKHFRTKSREEAEQAVRIMREEAENECRALKKRGYFRG